MKTLAITLPNSQTKVIAPVPRAKLGLFSSLMIQLQAIWIEEEFSTGDAIARDDAWDLMQQLWALLPMAADRDATFGGEVLEALSNDYEQLQRLFFGDASQSWQGSLATFDLENFNGAELWKLHEVSPRKKLIAADELRREKSRIEPSPPPMSPSKPQATKKRTRSRTSSTDLENSDTTSTAA